MGDVLDNTVVAINAASSGADIVISAANSNYAHRLCLPAPWQDTLVSGVNLSSQSIKNALATVSQFSESVAAIDITTLNTVAISTGGFNNLETVKASLANTAPTDIALSANLIKDGG